MKESLKIELKKSETDGVTLIDAISDQGKLLSLQIHFSAKYSLRNFMGLKYIEIYFFPLFLMIVEFHCRSNDKELENAHSKNLSKVLNLPLDLIRKYSFSDNVIPSYMINPNNFLIQIQESLTSEMISYNFFDFMASTFGINLLFHIEDLSDITEDSNPCVLFQESIVFKLTTIRPIQEIIQSFSDLIFELKVEFSKGMSSKIENLFEKTIVLLNESIILPGQRVSLGDISEVTISNISSDLIIDTIIHYTIPSSNNLGSSDPQ